METLAVVKDALEFTLHQFSQSMKLIANLLGAIVLALKVHQLRNP